VRDFQRIIGLEARAQVLQLTGRLPDAIAALAQEAIAIERYIEQDAPQ